MVIKLEETEKLKLENIHLKRQNLFMQDNLLKEQFDNILREFAIRNKIPFEKIKNINLELGELEVEDVHDKN